jgi:hypothetical protein
VIHLFTSYYLTIDLSIHSVLEAGQRHGAVRGDLYGCLYFYLGEQLRTFAERLSRFRVKFHVLCKDAQVLAQDISKGHLPNFFPEHTKFDRVDVSNTLDTYYIGIPKILSDWGPKLKHDQDAAVFGYFMNWEREQPGSSVTNSDSKTVDKLMSKMKELGRVDASFLTIRLY